MKKGLLCIITMLLSMTMAHADNYIKIRKTSDEIISLSASDISQIYFGEERYTDNELVPTEGEIIDLGLSVKWRSSNVGANSPEEYGAYFSWSETIEKDFYADGINVAPFKTIQYTRNYDAARANLDKNWRMPSPKEFEELATKCEWIWGTNKGVPGYLVKGINGNSIFLPVGGYKQQSDNNEENTAGCYWTSAKDDAFVNKYNGNAISFKFDNTRKQIAAREAYIGMNVRPVYYGLNSDYQYNLVSITDITSASFNIIMDYKNPHNYMFAKVGAVVKESGISDEGEKIYLSDFAYCDDIFKIRVNELNPGKKYEISAWGVIEDGMFAYQTVSPVISVTTKALNLEDISTVDLGLSVLWSSCNLGAYAPDDKGDYFAWGEVVPNKDRYDIDNWAFAAGNYHDITSTEYDAAHVTLGDGWRIPTETEVRELIAKCKWEKVFNKGTLGYKVTGPNGNSIFLPAAGYRSLDKLIDYADIGEYWISTVSANDSKQQSLYFYIPEDYKTVSIGSSHAIGANIRPVKSR